MKHHFRRTTSGKKCKTLVNQVLRNTEFRISGNSLSFSVVPNKFSGTFELSGKFDVPMPVKLSRNVTDDNHGASKSDAAEPNVDADSGPAPKSVEDESPEVIDLVSPDATKRKTKKETGRKKSVSDSGKKRGRKKKRSSPVGKSKTALKRISTDPNDSLESDVIIVSEVKAASQGSFPGKRKSPVFSPAVEPPQKRRRLSGEDSTERESTEDPNRKCLTPGSVTTPKPNSESKEKNSRKALKAVDPNQKSILQYFFSATSPLS